MDVSIVLWRDLEARIGGAMMDGHQRWGDIQQMTFGEFWALFGSLRQYGEILKEVAKRD